MYNAYLYIKCRNNKEYNKFIYCNHKDDMICRMETNKRRN